MPLPTLTSSGWVHNPNRQLAILFDYFLTTEDSQSNMFSDNIVSFQSYIQKYQHDPALLTGMLESALTNVLGNYFETSSVTVGYSQPDDRGKYGITIDATVSYKGDIYSLGRSVELVGSTVLAILSK